MPDETPQPGAWVQMALESGAIRHVAKWYYCPVCASLRQFEYKIHRDDYAGECGHRLTCQQAREQVRMQHAE